MLTWIHPAAGGKWQQLPSFRCSPRRSTVGCCNLEHSPVRAVQREHCGNKTSDIAHSQDSVAMRQ
eukprot:3083556-Amphidinium_carterae.1